MIRIETLRLARGLMAMLGALFFAGLSLPIQAAAKEDCVPPGFYTSLPRDRDWYYGVARDTDTEQARLQSLRNLGKQVTGDLEAWQPADIEKLAGPGQDRWEVAAQVGRLLPKSTLLAGWEQDDFARCDGLSYVLVRIEKDRVARYIRESQPFRKDLLDSLAKRLAKVEKRVDQQDCQIRALKHRLDRMAQALKPGGASGIPVQDSQGLQRRVSKIQDELAEGKPLSQIQSMIASVEDDYSRLLKRMQGYEKTHEAAQQRQSLALVAAHAPKIKEYLDRLNTGPVYYGTYAQLQALYQSSRQFQEEHAFFGEILYGRKRVVVKDPLQNGETEPLLAYAAVTADMSLEDDEQLLKDGEEFLKRYPDSRLYTSVSSLMESTMAKKRVAPQGFTPEPDEPCPGK
jgi:hypothetical protein